MKAVQQKWFVIVAMAAMLCLTGLVMSGTAFADRCVDNGDGTVTDNGTGLMWQKATAGPMNWDAAMSYPSGLSLGGHSGWGLPSWGELLNLYYHSPCKSLMEVVSSYYWSSSPYAGDRYAARRVGFDYGVVSHGHKSWAYYVRAVRAGQ